MLRNIRLVVTGGRKYSNRDVCYDILDAIHDEFNVSVLINGVAEGLDTLARDWAIDRYIFPEDYPVTNDQWVRIGKRMGHIRNQEMIDKGKPDVGVIFPGGNGTNDMKKRLLKTGILLFEVDIHGDIRVISL